jgi:hypothetical protein
MTAADRADHHLQAARRQVRELAQDLRSPVLDMMAQGIDDEIVAAQRDLAEIRRAP